MSLQSKPSVDRLLDVLEFDILPLTREGVAHGNKIFGAAILKKSDGSLVVAATNRETANPLWHGEVACLNDYWAMPASTRPAPQACWFLSTHEPCSMCLSAITWSGFDSIHYFFSYEDSKVAFAIPHDLNILAEVFGLREGDYRRRNAFWESHRVEDAIVAGNPEKRAKRSARAAAIRAEYDALSARYQASKAENEIPLA